VKQKIDQKIPKNILDGVETVMIQARYPVPVAEQLKFYCQSEGRVQYKVLVEALIEFLAQKGYKADADQKRATK